MTTYESKQKQILKPRKEVFATLCNLKHLEAYKDKLPTDGKVKNIEFEEEAISFEVDMIGQVVFKIIEKEEPKTIKFGVEQLPIPINMWIQLVEAEEADTRMKLTIKADIPMMLKPMIGNKLGDGIEKMAEMITTVLNAK